MKKTCKNCGKILSKKGKNYCRKCFQLLGTKTKRCCKNCGQRLSPSGSATGAIYCRSCFWELRTNKSETYMNKKWLIEHYIVQKLSLKECAIKANCGITTLDIWLQKLSIKPMNSWVKKKISKKIFKPSTRKTLNRGYVCINLSKDKRAKNNPYFSLREHQHIMEQHLDRYLKEGEQIHHLNGIKIDNRIENLKLFDSNSNHQKFEHAISFFAKQLIWGELSPKLQSQVKRLFTDFLSKYG